MEIEASLKKQLLELENELLKPETRTSRGAR